MTFPSIFISSYDQAEYLLGSEKGIKFLTHVISINDPDTAPPRTLKGHPGQHLILNFHDVSLGELMSSAIWGEWEESVPPTQQDVAQIIEFSKRVSPESKVLCHCAAGISRSAAAALILIASKLPPSSINADRAVQEVLRIKRDIHPNRRMIKFADDLLDYQGTLISALRS